ncbi:MAG: hypothetical protein IKV41_04365 [Oscillospiraceae bacterium]|nr:hypothetical protein [Oscillospiraceae bacterium]
MKNTLKIDHIKKMIIMDRTFEKLSQNTRSEEYEHLQRVRQDYPKYTVARREIKKNASKECYKGLTYEYMENYIKHVEGNNAEMVLKELTDKRLISQCHSKGHRYPTIKKWFLDKYPEVAKFGMSNTETKENNVETFPVIEAAIDNASNF